MTLNCACDINRSFLFTVVWWSIVNRNLACQETGKKPSPSKIFAVEECPQTMVAKVTLRALSVIRYLAVWMVAAIKSFSPRYFWPKMVSEAISECLNFKNFPGGACPQTSNLLCAYSYRILATPPLNTLLRP